MLKSLPELARALVAPSKGILAADESVSSMNKRLAKIGVAETSESARRFRELLFSAPHIEDYLSGVILFDETLRQNDSRGKSFAHVLESKGIIPGIKVDKGLVPFPNFPEEEVTEGLDGLSLRLREYYELGARFTKWRAVIRITEDTPTEGALTWNMHAMARYAALVQDAHMVPMVEPEVLYDGTHTVEESADILRETLYILFDALDLYRVDLTGLILKTSMALPGKDSGTALEPLTVARETMRALTEAVPEEVAGVVFLSGGQTPEEATRNLQEIARFPEHPWELTFSYSRALQEPALEAWRGLDANVEKAQAAFLERLKANVAAREGKYVYR